MVRGKMNLSVFVSALRVTSLPSSPNKRAILFCGPILFRQAFIISSVTLRPEAYMFRMPAILYIYMSFLWDGVVNMRSLPPIFLLSGSLELGCWLLYLDMLVGEPIKRCAQPTQLQALGIFHIRASFDSVSSLQFCSPWDLFLMSSLEPNNGGKKGEVGRAGQILLAGAWYILCLYGSLLLGVFMLF